ncbi:MAG: hypothetical protein P8Y18_04370 [Candidatus Bathyarchaeota archaeon]
MRIQIAVATVSGRTYYEFVNELNRKKLSFLSLKPWDPIPFNIKVVLTTQEESKKISHPNILFFGEKINPESIIDEALLIIMGKKQYNKVIIGVDPGETCGIAIVCDNKVLETMTTTMEDAANLVIKNLKRFPAESRISNKSFNRRILRDSISAIKIAGRTGRKLERNIQLYA